LFILTIIKNFKHINIMKITEKLKSFPKDSTEYKTLHAYLKKYQDQEVVFIRVPARINLLGTHIDHRGGYLNYLSIDKEFFCVAGKRKDRKVAFFDVKTELYAEGEFDIDKELPNRPTDWLTYIRQVKIIPGDYSNYIKSAILYLQNHFHQKNLSGMNLAFYGDIPVGAGLSSSSAVVVAVMLSTVLLNNLDIEKGALSEMCGKAEWYVGTRGGCGDHAAMLFGKKNQIAHIRFFPFSIEYLPFPENYRIISCNSLVEAKKSMGAKNIFNERIVNYEIGFRLIKKNFPELAPKLSYLRDINPKNLGSEKLIYEILLSLPETIRRKDIIKELPEENLDFFFESHIEPASGYRLRDAVMFGITECERSRICSKFLKNMDIDTFGKLMFISHDGDRIVNHLPDGKIIKKTYSVDNAHLKELIKYSESSDPSLREESKLFKQPGAYRCSTEELDFIVDTVKPLKGVKGAKLTGAGLGGTVLILVEKDQADNVMDVLSERYYKLKGLKESAFVCVSVDGAGEI